MNDIVITYQIKTNINKIKKDKERKKMNHPLSIEIYRLFSR